MSTLPRPLKWPPTFPLQKGLVAWYPFDDRSGAVLRDRSGQGNHGTLYGPTWVAGRRGSALSFDGSNDYVKVPDSASLKLTDAITLEAWIKPSVWRYHGIMAKGAFTGVFGDYILNQVDYGNIIFSLNSTGGELTSGVKPAVGLWTHIVATYSVSSGKMRLYFNGVKGTLETNYSTAINTSATDLRIGQYYSASYFWSGAIGEVRVYNRALNAAEIKRLYESELMLVRH